MRLTVGPLLLAAATACAAPGPYGSIPVDHAGFRERWRRACELEKMSALESTCVEIDGGLSESDSDPRESGAPEDDAGAEADETEAAATVGPFSPSSSGQPAYGPDGG